MNIRRNVSRALVSRGFQQNGRLHRKALNEDISFWVDIGPLDSRSDIAPFAGIRHNGVERTTADLLGLPFDEWCGTAGANVGYLVGGEYRVWGPDASADDVVLVVEVAIEKLSALATLGGIIEIQKIRGAQEPLWRYREVVVLLLQGNSSAAIERLKIMDSLYRRVGGEVYEQFTSFCARARDTAARITAARP